MAKTSSKKFDYNKNFCIMCKLPLQRKKLSFKLTLHSFPLCPKIRRDWINQCGLPEEVVLPNSKLCSSHFSSNCFKSNVKRRLLCPDAVPTIFNRSYVPPSKLPPKLPKVIITKKPTKTSNVCVLCSKSKLNHPSPDISLHLFPSCPTKLRVWLNQCKLTKKEILRNRKICSSHFESTCFKPGLKKRRLYPDAVPTIFKKDQDKKDKDETNDRHENTIFVRTVKVPTVESLNEAKTIGEIRYMGGCIELFKKYLIEKIKEKDKITEELQKELSSVQAKFEANKNKLNSLCNSDK